MPTRAKVTTSQDKFFKPTFNSSSPMYKYQDSLHCLPVPTLEETCERYWKSALPLFKNSDEKNHTRNVIDEFVKSKFGKELQQRLLERKAKMDKIGRGWLIDWWNDYAYMAYRDPVVINVNYFFQFVNDPFRTCQVSRAAAIIESCLKFRDIYIKQELEADTAGRGNSLHGLCMNQYRFMFNACRIPKMPADIVHTYDPSKNHHVAVLRKGKLYILSTVDESGNRLSTADIEAQLKTIKEDADANGHEPFPLTALTTQNRDIWTRAREELVSYSPLNNESLEKLESAVFLLCLDDTSPLTREEVGRSLWHGDGRNRFFDKSLQFIVFENGKAGFNGEHSMMDATPTFRLCEFVCEEFNLKSPPQKSSLTSTKPITPKQLLFHYPESFETYIPAAITRFQADVYRHDHKVLAFLNYGKEKMKHFGVSPDAFVQLSIQLGFFKLFGECRATYESAQTKKYAWGRTETCRSVTEESAAFVHAAADPTISVAKKAALAKDAIKAHTNYMAHAVDARGVDRHFLGLKKLIKQGEKLPEIFTDSVFSRSCHWNLSTSQISSEFFDGYGWGEVVSDGYGIAYMIKNDSVHYNIASVKGGKGWEHGPGSWQGPGKGIENPCQKMAAAIEEGLLELKNIFEADSVTKTKAKL